MCVSSNCNIDFPYKISNTNVKDTNAASFNFGLILNALI